MTRGQRNETRTLPYDIRVSWSPETFHVSTNQNIELRRHVFTIFQKMFVFFQVQQTKFEDPIMNGASVAPTSEVRDVLTLMTVLESALACS
jgi:hypothetical protein